MALVVESEPGLHRRSRRHLMQGWVLVVKEVCPFTKTVLSLQHCLENLVTNMTMQQFLMMGEEVGREAGVLDGLQGYFRQHARRLHQSCAFFDLFSRQLGE